MSDKTADLVRRLRWMAPRWNDNRILLEAADALSQQADAYMDLVAQYERLAESCRDRDHLMVEMETKLRADDCWVKVGETEIPEDANEYRAKITYTRNRSGLFDERLREVFVRRPSTKDAR